MPDPGERVTVEYFGQLTGGVVVRRFLFLWRVKMVTDDGYFLAWVPRWRVYV